MQQPDMIKQYLETVKKQIRWRKAHPILLEEIENHIADQKNAFVNDGCDEETALEKSIAEMGDAVAVGEALDRTHRPKPDWWLLAITGAILLVGIIFQLLVETNQGKGELFVRQLVWAGIAVVAMIGAYFADFTTIGRYPRIIYFSLGVLTVFSFFVGGTVNGASKYAIYPLLLYPAAYAGFIHSMRGKSYGGLVLCGIVFLVPALLALLVPSLTVLVLLSISCLILLSGAILKGIFNVRKPLALLIVFLSAAISIIFTIFVVLLNRGGYAFARLQVFLDPSWDPRAGYIGNVVQNLLSHSRFIGEGYPINELRSLSLLPGASTDFIMVYLIYRFGWIIFMGIAVLFSAFVLRAIRLSGRQQSNLGALVSRAVILTISIEIILYIVANMGFLLFSPLSLPLISYGGGALVVNMALIGLLLSVYRTGDLVKDKPENPRSLPNSFIQYEKGRIIINLTNRAAK